MHRVGGCKDSERHYYIEDGHHIPPFNEALFLKLRARRVQIIVGPNRKDGD